MIITPPDDTSTSYFSKSAEKKHSGATTAAPPQSIAAFQLMTPRMTPNYCTVSEQSVMADNPSRASSISSHESLQQQQRSHSSCTFPILHPLSPHRGSLSRKPVRLGAVSLSDNSSRDEFQYMDQTDMEAMDGVSIEERPTDCIRRRQSSLPYSSARVWARENSIPRSAKRDDEDISVPARRHSGSGKRDPSSLVTQLAEYRFQV